MLSMQKVWKLCETLRRSTSPYRNLEYDKSVRKVCKAQ